ncbi:MAG: alpha-amylase family glycosyl hydrolase [Verrucomicrobiota bacterium]
MVQYFNTSWKEITRKMPELAEAGYESIWLPPPTKGSGGLSVGYDLWDRFDLGSIDQRGSTATRYGTEADLLELVRVAHRFGIRIYFDNIMNHNAFDVPGFNEFVPIDIYPGFLPEDFHLRVTEEGFYRKWDNTRDWGSAWQVQNLGLADLIDIAHENPNTNFGPSEGDDHPKISFVRQPNNPEYYFDTDLPQGTDADGVTVYTFADKEPFTDSGWGLSNIGAGNGRFDFDDANANGQHDAGETSEPFTDLGLFPNSPGRQSLATGAGDSIFNMGNPVSEDVNAIVIRAARWKLDRTKADGLRLDAVKHVPDYFYGLLSGASKDQSGAGYNGGAQTQFNLTRGFVDWSNHRDTVFDTESPRDDAMLFGEHLGEPPGFGGYVDSGMRLVDNNLRSRLNGDLGNPFSTLAGLDGPGGGGFAPAVAVMHAQSHDNDFAAMRELQHAMYFTREGLPLVYTDGNFQAETLSQSGGAFPRHANTAFLGQFGDPRLPNLMQLHQAFARGFQSGLWSDSDLVSYERRDDRENNAMIPADEVTAVILINDNTVNGQRPFDRFGYSTAFPANAYLYQYAIGPAAGGDSMTGFYVTMGNAGGNRSFFPDTVTVPRGGYYIFSWRSPEQPEVWESNGTPAITILQDGNPTSSLTYSRMDGPDGDPAFNPYGLPDADPTDFAYDFTVPRVTGGTNLSFVVRTDGSTENVLVKLDGGVDVNSQMHRPGVAGQEFPGHPLGDARDNPPALSTDVFLGYEQIRYAYRIAEKFAAANISRNVIGSPGSESYEKTIGSGSVTVNNATESINTNSGTVTWVFHDPAADNHLGAGNPQYQENGPNIDIYVKVGYQADNYNGVTLYYTTDGGANPFPEGSGGTARENTMAAAGTFVANGTPDGSGIPDWWRFTIPAPANGSTLRYKIGACKHDAPSVFPSGASEVALKKRMETRFEVAPIAGVVPGFNAETASHRPHNDYGEVATGLEEGFHVLRARAFLKRDGAAEGNGLRSSVYNTFTQTFYYDAQPPGGEILFPATNGTTLASQNFGVVVRTDPSVAEVWYQIVDGDATNDDSTTGVLNGNGPGFEPFTDTNTNGTWDAGEPFEDLDENGVFTSNLSASWVRATDVTLTPNIGGNPSYTKEWRFNYNNIPSSGTAQIHVRLREISSAERKDFTDSPTGADDIAKHYTTITRSVNTAGPNIRLFVAFPQMDSDVVSDSYVMQAYFSKALGTGVSDSQLLSEFLIKIGSTISGTDVDAVTQDPALYSIIRDETTDYHALAYTFPNLFNGDPNFLHHLEVTHTRSGSPPLAAIRLVKALEVNDPFVNITTPPEFDSDGRRFEIELPDVASPTADQRSTPIVVETDTTAAQVDIVFEFGTGTVTLDTGQPINLGSKLLWNFTWSSMTEGDFRFRADMRQIVAGPVVASNTRNATVVFRESLPSIDDDPDDDDDGLLDANELTPVDLPETNSETWTNGEVHVYNIFGRTDPTSPDTDGDDLPDALEAGWRVAGIIGEPYQDTGIGTTNVGAGNGRFDWDDTNSNGSHDAGETSEPFTDGDSDNEFDYGTITTADTNGDGFPNFIADLDPPFYNTVPDNNGLPNYNFNAGRTNLIHGTMTDPNNPDTDGDGLSDGTEDADRNGHVFGDGDPLPPTANPNTRVNWPNGKMDVGETWQETDPNNPDTDDDDLSDGFGEDKNLNGTIDGDTNNNRAYDAGEAWTETDPINNDTDGDGLLDGWETQNGLDPLDNGTDNLATATPNDGDPSQGASGDPDSDTFDNITEQANGTKPLVPDHAGPPPAASIVIGPGVAETVGQVTNGNEFTDWTCNDIVVLDEYEGDGQNNQGGDIYLGYDGFDSSRDIVAFYFRDGGADGRVYFRVDMYDLRAFAEEGNLDIYVAIDTGNTSVGEFALPDQLDIGTDMRWEAVVACYQSGVGTVYLDTDAGTNSTNINENLFGANGVVARSQNSANGFLDSYYNSDLDAVEFSVARQALLDAGWNGSNPLNFQVFTTRDGTQNDGTGAGDIGGRNDLRDTIYDDSLSEDYFFAQANIAANGKLTTAISNAPDKCKRTKLVILAHANKAIRPGSDIHSLINTGFATGYHRSVDAHDAFDQPLTLHITPTLASAIEWAAVDPAAGKPFLDGPSFNDRLTQLKDNNLLDLLGSTFSDHILPYFDNTYNADNVSLATEFLAETYGSPPSTSSFYVPERVADDEVLGAVATLGYSHTFVDQMRHLFKWFGRDSALSNDGYRLNEINGVKCFIINDQASTFRYVNSDNGLSTSLRNLFSRKARSGTQDQAVVLFHQWEEFADTNNADAFDKNLRWIANTPWVEVVTPSAIAAGDVDFTGDGVGDVWGTVNRGTPTLDSVALDFVDHATQENYDNWYNGQAGREEGLSPKVFNIRTGAPLSQAYGRQSANDSLLIDDSWDVVQTMSNLGSPLGKLGRGTAHTSTLLTAFHQQQNNNLAKFSNGDYISPDIDFNGLAGFSFVAQSQTRFAPIYKRVETWALAPPTSLQSFTAAEDVDLDGENEYLLYNNQVFALFEAIGGRLVAAWSRNPNSGLVYQVIGNHWSFANSGTEEEGDTNNTGALPNAHRTSGFKDWFYNDGTGTSEYVNSLYIVTPAANGWTFTAPASAITKTITLLPNSPILNGAYSLANSTDDLFVRFGLSPNLLDLLLHGQANLGPLQQVATLGTRLATTTPEDQVAANVALTDASFVSTAVDDAAGAGFTSDALNMRNQAQTHQVEFQNTAQNFTLSLNLGTNATDDDLDTLPTNWELANNLSPIDNGSGNIDNGPAGNPDGDSLTNDMEFLYNLNPQVADDHLIPQLELIANGDGTYDLEFPTFPDREYNYFYSDDLGTWLPMGGDRRVTIPAPNFRTTDDGTETSPHPNSDPRRYYNVIISFPANP